MVATNRGSDTPTEPERINQEIESNIQEKQRIELIPMGLEEMLDCIKTKRQAAIDEQKEQLRKLVASYANRQEFESALDHHNQLTGVRYREITERIDYLDRLLRDLPNLYSMPNLWPKTMSADEKDRRLRKLREERLALEEQREKIRVRLELSGVEVDPSANVLPEVFLADNDGKLNTAKFADLVYRSRAVQRVVADIGKDIANSRAELRENEAWIQKAESSNSGTPEQRARRQAEIERLKKAIAEYEARKSGPEKRIVRLQEITNNCEAFLRSRNAMIEI